MFNLEYLKKMHNSLELVAFQKYPKLKKIKLYLEKLSSLEFTRMTSFICSFYWRIFLQRKNGKKQNFCFCVDCFWNNYYALLDGKSC